MIKKIFLILIFIQAVLKLFSLDFKIDEKMYFKVQNQFSDYSYLPESQIGNLGYKTQYIKLQISSLKNDYYIFSPNYKLYSKPEFHNFYYYSKFKMHSYNFLVKTINMAKINSGEILFDTRQLLNNLSESPIIILQRLFLDKNFIDKNGNIIENPEDKIFIFLINSTKFTNLLPDGDYIKDFFVCVYYNEDDLSDDEIIKSITWNNIPMPIGKNYKKYPVYEKAVMAKLKEEKNLTKEAEENLYNDLAKEMQKINMHDDNKQFTQEEVEQQVTTIKDSIKKKIIPITPKETKVIIDTLPQIKTSNIIKEKTQRELTTPEIISNKIEEKSKKKIIIPTEKEENIPQKTKPKKKKIIKEKPAKKTTLPPKTKEKPKKETKQTILPKETKYSTIKIEFINKGDKFIYPLEKDLSFNLQIKGENLKAPIKAQLSDISKVTTIPIEIKSIDYADTISISVPIGYSVNGVYADSVFTTLVNLNKIHKVKFNLKKLPVFPLILIDKSEILPIEWLGLEAIIKDIKKSVNMKNQYGIFYVDNEKIKGDFSAGITETYEDYLWETIYPLATSSGIRMEHLFRLAEKWNKTTYSKRYKPQVHLFLSRATLKSLIAMDNWEMTRKRFNQLKEKIGDSKIVIHSKIKKKDNIPLFKLGLPFRKIK